MVDFDYQWKQLPTPAIDYNDDRLKEFVGFSSTITSLKGKLCLDAGCGNGRYTYAMLKLGAQRVDSIDISEEAIGACRRINPDNAWVQDIYTLQSNPIYDFVLCWGVLNHVATPREVFSKVVSQVKLGGLLHIMVYHKYTQKQYEDGRKKWPKMSHEKRIKYCSKMIKKYKSGDLHGWWDALNPTYNWSWHEDEIRKWFEEEGFGDIVLTQKYNINMQGRRKG